MKTQKITSRDNTLLRTARAVRDGKKPDFIFIEGLRLCEEALRSQLQIEAVIYSEEIAAKDRAARFLERVRAVCDRLGVVSERLLATVSYTKTPQGLISIAKRPESGVERLRITKDETPLVVVLHGINNPVNVGAILRSAEAAGVTGVIATAKTSDPFSPKSLRGAMGSAFRLPIWYGPTYEDALAWCVKQNIDTVCAAVHGKTSYTDVYWKRSTALIVGPEAEGLTKDEIEAAQTSITIPMLGEVESLNVAVATAVVLYEAARQRSKFLGNHARLD